MVRGGFVALGLVAAVVAALVAGTSAQSSGCTTVIISLAPCLGFIQGNSTAPPSTCCTQLASVVQSQPRCLCQVLNGGTGPLVIAVNRTQALALPAACKVQTPPVSQCNGTYI
ncbi:hypothetical protein Taro_014270 [Colocasia esculenta]|uniref:Bifunctional inhibitor/plant lipid transfer protein/seed storage helical domain-containing protein n=1 Tax=Colocasia esculenta TaxID=4460 RepID=A0A843UE89_COLES|nr:hypothetical protein [Colocasia esculenta]